MHSIVKSPFPGQMGNVVQHFRSVDQIRRAGVSIMSNIGDRFERGSTKELIQTLFIAKGSCGEVRGCGRRVWTAKDRAKRPPSPGCQRHPLRLCLSEEAARLVLPLWPLKQSHHTAPHSPEG